MGYTTEFEGEFKINKLVDTETAKLIRGICTTRRMKRKIEGYGIDGEFFIDGKGFMGQDHEENIVDYNTPPRTQPGLWCQWELQEDNQTIMWNEGEKFYDYVEWIKYLIESILKPKDYMVSGEMTWEGEENEDIGKIIIQNNVVTTLTGHIVYS